MRRSRKPPSETAVEQTAGRNQAFEPVHASIQAIPYAVSHGLVLLFKRNPLPSSGFMAVGCWSVTC